MLSILVITNFTWPWKMWHTKNIYVVKRRLCELKNCSLCSRDFVTTVISITKFDPMRYCGLTNWKMESYFKNFRSVYLCQNFVIPVKKQASFISREKTCLKLHRISLFLIASPLTWNGFRILLIFKRIKTKQKETYGQWSGLKN